MLTLNAPLGAHVQSSPHSRLLFIVQQSHQNRRVPFGKNGHHRNIPNLPKMFCFVFSVLNVGGVVAQEPFSPKTLFQLGVGLLQEYQT